VIAAQAGISPQILFLWERGLGLPGSVSQVLGLARALGCREREIWRLLTTYHCERFRQQCPDCRGCPFTVLMNDQT
jgi:hypothetical protein